MPLILGANSVSGYTVKNSLRFNSASSDYLNKTFGTATNRKIFTFSVWVKRSILTTNNGYLMASGTDASINVDEFYLRSGDTLDFSGYESSTTVFQLRTTQLFRDVSAWYHLMVAYDSTQATSSNRIKMYVNGSQVTSFSIATYPSLNLEPLFNSATAHTIARNLVSGSRFQDGYLSEYNFIDGQALTPSSFGETDTLSGIWIPKAYTGTYGTNGFFLKFANSASLGTDSSGNGNTFTVNNLTSIDQTTDTPTNNFCTLNPLDKNSSVTLSEGNLKVSTSVVNVGVFGNFAVSKGKWYFEVVRDNSSNITILGIAQSNWDKSYVGYTNSIGYGANGIIYVNGSTAQSSLATYTTSDVIGIRLDLDGGSVTFYKNNVQVGTAVTGLSGEYFPAVSGQESSIFSVNFGNPPYSGGSYTDGAGYGNFSYAVPSGYYSLCTKNLADYG
jgi:hypothetical protein